ncbi:MAG: enoyl-CoA hydratase [Myxococcales bacterium]|nr:enoyl-CoA hydratase [Myxococcota bacterium]MDW8280878.1 enoyl-CoA hydratase [Myxococcales bacterium]
MNNDSDEVLVTDDGPVRIVALNRPASRNGLTIPVNARLIEAFQAAGDDDRVRAVLLTGRGGHFCSGLDLKAAMALVQQQGEMGDREEQMRTYFHGLIRAVRALDKPVVALVDGPAVGFGCDLALACDIRLATPGARLGEVFVRRGLMPDGGGTYMLPRLVGLGRALDLMMTGDVIDAREAERIGLVSRIVQDEAEARSLVRRIAEGPPLVLREIKRAVYAALSGNLDTALEAEVAGQMRLLQTQDFVEGITAFLLKRPPQFKGR